MHKTITSNPLEAKIAFETNRFHFYFSLTKSFSTIFFFHPTLYDSCLKSSLLYMFLIPIFMLFITSFVLFKNYQVKNISAYKIQKVMVSRFNESKFGFEVHKFIYFVSFLLLGSNPLHILCFPSSFHKGWATFIYVTYKLQIKHLNTHKK
jgi:hypothetical protein